jgi:hypothetical protein
MNYKVVPVLCIDLGRTTLVAQSHRCWMHSPPLIILLLFREPRPRRLTATWGPPVWPAMQSYAQPTPGIDSVCRMTSPLAHVSCTWRFLTGTWYERVTPVYSDQLTTRPIFRRPQVQISARRQAILTEGFRDFPQSLQANAMIVHYN